MATEPTIRNNPDSAVTTALDQLGPGRDHERLSHRNEQLEEQVRALLVLQEVANTLSAELNLAPLLRRIAIAALRLTSAEVSIVYLVSPDGKSLSLSAVETAQTAADSGVFSTLDLASLSQPGWEPEEISSTSRPSIGIGDGVAGAAATTGMLVLIPEPQADPRFDLSTIGIDAHLLGIQPSALLAVPMVFTGSVSGVLEVAHADQSGGFDASNLDLLRTLAAQAATAVANAQLYQRLRSERDRIIQAQEDERKRLGRDLHDGPAQRLAQIAMSLEFAEKLIDHDPAQLRGELASIRESVNSTTREIRNLLFDLRPLVLEAEHGGLVVALRHFLERFKTAPGPHLHLFAEYPQRLPHNVELTIFAIIQEAVNNSVKHANATNCWIEVHEYEDRLVATIRDDGNGFDVRRLQDEYETRGSWGLLNMADRAALIDAKLNIGSQPSRGTVVSLELAR
jgi:signal transduction histidine kinase